MAATENVGESMPDDAACGGNESRRLTRAPRCWRNQGDALRMLWLGIGPILVSVHTEKSRDLIVRPFGQQPERPAKERS